MNYSEAIQFLYNLRLFGTKLGLENTRTLAALIGNPQDRLRFIHVAGTNGKGSVCAMLENIYRATGLRVGLFTSPHLVAFGERIQVNRQLISEADVARLVAEMQPLFKEFPADHHPTFFEAVTVMALRYFSERQCDLVIWETGMGGRLDATNIVTPLASVITNVQFDHQQWLGQTHAQIAVEKAGIIKPGIPVVTATYEPEALAVIQAVARTNNAPLAIVRSALGDDPSDKPMASLPSALPMSLASLQAPEHPSPALRAPSPLVGRGERDGVRGVPLDSGAQGAHHVCGIPAPLALSLLGEHQRLNAAVALATVRVLQPQLSVGAAAIRHGLEHVHWPGRLQLIRLGEGKQILLDGAHNTAGTEALVRALRQYFPERKPAMVLGVLGDKDWPAICGLIAPFAHRICLVPVSSGRSADPVALAPVCHRANPTARISVHASVEEALRVVASEPFVLVTGSLYLVGETMERLGTSPARSVDERGLNEWTM